jgi:hypothetical protein
MPRPGPGFRYPGKEIVRMKLFWRTPFVPVLGLVAMAGIARAGKATPDTSLEREVEHYLENNGGADGEPSNFRAFWRKGSTWKAATGTSR